MERTIKELRALQALPLSAKITMSLQRIQWWGEHWGEDNIYYSFSGGKDSTVLRDLVLRVFPNAQGVFVNTGLEYPEIQAFVKLFGNIEILRPKMRFDEVIKKYGYPFISKEVSNKIRLARENINQGVYSLRLKCLGVEESDYGGLKRLGNYDYEKTATGSKFTSTKYKKLLETDFILSEQCCDVMKKKPIHDYKGKNKKMPILGSMASESMARENAWIKVGCNAFEAKAPRSAPLSFWTEQDVLQYIKERNLAIASIYGDIVTIGNDGQEYAESLCDGRGKLTTTGCKRTGCIFCGFGAHLEKDEGRFVRLKRTHPKQYDYCMGGGAYDTDGFWKPNEQGLGMAHVIDELCRIYGKNFIKY